jgi:hypothetical protein
MIEYFARLKNKTYQKATKKKYEKKPQKQSILFAIYCLCFPTKNAVNALFNMFTNFIKKIMQI